MDRHEAFRRLRRRAGGGTAALLVAAALAASLSAPAGAEPGPRFVLPEPPGMSGPQDTSGLVAILSQLGKRMSPREALLRVVGPFPVAGEASWFDDWHAFRPTPSPHLHEGLDMMAAYGTPAVAAVNGVVTELEVDDSGGLIVGISDARGTQFVYMHLSDFASGLAVGHRVRRGDVIGFVGTSGNASSPHLHFEIRPGGVAVPPKPFVDRWLLVAEERARQLVRAVVHRGAGRFLPRPEMEPVVPPAALPHAPRLQGAQAPMIGPAVSVGAFASLVVALALLGGATAGRVTSRRRRRPVSVGTIAGESLLDRPLTLERLTPVPDARERRPSPRRSAVVGASVTLGVLLLWALRSRRRSPSRA